MLIGAGEDRIPNTYADMTVAGTKGIAATGNAAVFALRSTHMSVEGLTIKNSDECGILWRNCSDTLVRRCAFQNLAHFGVEWSLTTAAVDGGTATMPDRSRQSVVECDFQDMPDLALGTGNGNGVGGFGGPEAGAYYDYNVLDCTFRRCQRDVHYELSTAQTVIDGAHIRISSRDARQGSVGLVNVRNYKVEVEAINPGGAPTQVLSPNYADIFGLVISGPESTKGVAEVLVIDHRNSKAYHGTNGTITAGSRVFTSTGASFLTTARAGDAFGLLGAGPSGVCLVTTIDSVDSNTQLTLDMAAGTTVSGAEYAFGGATRYGVIVNEGGDLKLSGMLDAGIYSGFSRTLDVEGVPTVVPEPESAGLYIAAAASGRIDSDGLQIAAPTTQGTTPTGVLMTGALAGLGKYRAGGISVRGFTNSFVGVDNHRSTCIGPAKLSTTGLAVEPSATIDTFGTEEFVTPNGDRFSQLLGGSFTFDLAAELLTVRVTAYRFDGATNTVDIQSNTNGENKELSEFNLWQINQDNASLSKIGIKVKSSIATSTGSVSYYFRALEGGNG